jgi:3-deoxy-manno-octulosonate cytidylyltransferase (CMP-KDO synthetase)
MTLTHRNRHAISKQTTHIDRTAFVSRSRIMEARPIPTDRGTCAVFIPARLASTRLPDKPLADIHGVPMIVHVWRRAVAAAIGPVIVASADSAIADAIAAVGGTSVMTDPGLPSGSDRVFAALEAIDAERRIDTIVNVQGDLPTIDPALIGRVLAPLDDPAVDIATLVCPIGEESERTRPSVVKAVVAWQPGGQIGRALYFSRATIPWGDGELLHHIGLYAYRRAALERFVRLPAAPLEQRESLEQLRALEAGMRIDVARVTTIPLGVDTPDDLDRARAMLAAPQGGITLA